MKKHRIGKLLGSLTLASISFVITPITSRAATSGEVSSNVPSGTYNTTKTVTLTCSTGDPIYYTNNGTFPNTSSTKYTW